MMHVGEVFHVRGLVDRNPYSFRKQRSPFKETRDLRKRAAMLLLSERVDEGACVGLSPDTRPDIHLPDQKRRD